MGSTIDLNFYLISFSLSSTNFSLENLFFLLTDFPFEHCSLGLYIFQAFQISIHQNTLLPIILWLTAWHKSLLLGQRSMCCNPPSPFCCYCCCSFWKLVMHWIQSSWYTVILEVIQCMYLIMIYVIWFGYNKRYLDYMHDINKQHNRFKFLVDFLRSLQHTIFSW